MADFTKAHNFRLVVAFHTQGEEIYSETIVLRFADVSGYQPVRYVESDAGYKDWFIQDWRRPGFTVEAGKGKKRHSQLEEPLFVLSSPCVRMVVIGLRNKYS